MFELTQLTGVDLSIYIILLGAILLFFGKVVADTKVEKYDKLGYYIEGLIFSGVFVFIPFLFVYYIKDILRIPALILFFIQLLILVFLTWNIVAHEYFRRHGLIGEFKKIAVQKLNQIKGHNSFIGTAAKSRESWILSYVESVYYNIPIKLFGNKLVLLFFSFETILSNFQLYESNELLIFGISLLFTFLILTMVAMAHGFNNAYYPPAKIHMVDGEIIEGKILKISDYVYILKDDKKIFINGDKINYFEENLFKDKK